MIGSNEVQGDIEMVRGVGDAIMQELVDQDINMANLELRIMVFQLNSQK